MNSSITHIFNQALLTMLRCVEEDAFSWAENPLDSGDGSYDDRNVPRQRLSALVSEFVSLKSVLLLMMPLCEKKWGIDTSAVPRFYDYELHQKGIFPRLSGSLDSADTFGCFGTDSSLGVPFSIRCLPVDRGECITDDPWWSLTL